MGFPAAGPIPPGTPAGIARVYDNHQQYLSSNKKPQRALRLGGTGVSCPVGVARADG